MIDSRGARPARSVKNGPAFWMAFSPCQGRALCDVRPTNVTSAWREPVAPS